MKIKLKEPGSAITHFIGAVFAIIGAIPLLIRESQMQDLLSMFSILVFIISMILLYSASTLYHSIDSSARVNELLKKMDHMMIFILIAGSYTPVALIALRGKYGYILFGLVWFIALFGIIIKWNWIYCPKWFSSAIYIAMGWVCIVVFIPLKQALSSQAFFWLLFGGIIYTVGGIIYALKVPIFNLKHKNFGSHEIFHLFVLGGSICHFIMIFEYISLMSQ